MLQSLKSVQICRAFIFQNQQGCPIAHLNTPNVTTARHLGSTESRKCGARKKEEGRGGDRSRGRRVLPPFRGVSSLVTTIGCRVNHGPLLCLQTPLLSQLLPSLQILLDCTPDASVLNHLRWMSNRTCLSRLICDWIL